ELAVLDGWWPEGYRGDNGWAVGGGRVYHDEERGDAADADSLYTLLEQEVVPLYYQRDAAGPPAEWLRRSAAAIATVAPRFNAGRMVKEYVRRFYLPASARGRRLAAGDASRRLAEWRARVERAWQGVAVEAGLVSPEVARAGDPVVVTATVTAPGWSQEELAVE